MKKITAILIAITFSSSIFAKKINLRQTEFAESVTFEIYGVKIITDKKSYDKYIEEEFKAGDPNKEVIASIVQSQGKDAVMNDTLIHFFKRFLNAELDNGKAMVKYGAENKIAKYIKREYYNIVNVKNKGQYYYIEEQTTYFYNKILKNVVTDL